MNNYQINILAQKKIEVELGSTNLDAILKQCESYKFEDKEPYLRESSIYGEIDFDKKEIQRIVERIYKLLSLTEDDIQFSKEEFLESFFVPMSENSNFPYFAFLDDQFLASADMSGKSNINEKYREYVRKSFRFFNSFEEMLVIFKDLEFKKLASS